MRANRDTVVRLSSLLVLGAGLLACDQPSPKCGIARGTFSAKYTLVAGSVTGAGDCGGLVGEELYVQAYNQRKKDSPYPDPDNIQIGIISSTQQGVLDRASCSEVTNTAAATPYALGSFAKSDPGKDDFCIVPTLTPSQVTVAAQDACSPDPCFPPLDPEPAHDVSYEWSNVRVYVTAAANGTQFAADLKYTMDGCSAQYKVVAVYPSVSCAAFPSTEMNPATGDDAGEDDAGTLPDGGLGGMDSAFDNDSAVADPDATTVEPGEDDAGEFVPPEDCDPPAPAGPDPIADQSLCSPDAPLSENGPTGSNINPEFMVQCDSQQLRCVLSGDPPSLR